MCLLCEEKCEEDTINVRSLNWSQQNHLSKLFHCYGKVKLSQWPSRNIAIPGKYERKMSLVLTLLNCNWKYLEQWFSESEGWGKQYRLCFRAFFPHIYYYHILLGVPIFLIYKLWRTGNRQHEMYTLMTFFWVVKYAECFYDKLIRCKYLKLFCNSSLCFHLYDIFS